MYQQTKHHIPPFLDQMDVHQLLQRYGIADREVIAELIHEEDQRRHQIEVQDQLFNDPIEKRRRLLRKIAPGPTAKEHFRPGFNIFQARRGVLKRHWETFYAQHFYERGIGDYEKNTPFSWGAFLTSAFVKQDGVMLYIYEPVIGYFGEAEPVETQADSSTAEGESISEELMAEFEEADQLPYELQLETFTETQGTQEIMPEQTGEVETVLYKQNGIVVVETAYDRQIDAWNALNEQKILSRNRDELFIWRERVPDADSPGGFKFVDHRRFYNFMPEDMWNNRHLEYNAEQLKEIAKIIRKYHGDKYDHLIGIVARKQTFTSAEFATLVRVVQQSVYKDKKRHTGIYDAETRKDVKDQYHHLVNKEYRARVAKELTLAIHGESYGPDKKYRRYVRNGRELIIEPWRLKYLREIIEEGDKSTIANYTNNKTHKTALADYYYMLTPTERRDLLKVFANMYWLNEGGEEETVNTILGNVPETEFADLRKHLKEKYDSDETLYQRLRYLVDNYGTRQDFFTHTKRIMGAVDTEFIQGTKKAATNNDSDLDTKLAYMTEDMMATFSWEERKKVLDSLMDDTYWDTEDSKKVVELIRSTPPEQRAKFKPHLLVTEKENAAYYDSLVSALKPDDREEFYAVLEKFYPNDLNTYKLYKLYNLLDNYLELIETIRLESYGNTLLQYTKELTDKEVKRISKSYRKMVIQVAFENRFFSLDETSMQGVIDVIALAPESHQPYLRELLTANYGAYLQNLYTYFTGTGIENLRDTLQTLFAEGDELAQLVRKCLSGNKSRIEALAYLINDQTINQLTVDELVDLIQTIIDGNYTDGWNETAILNIMREVANVPLKTENETKEEKAERQRKEKRRTQFGAKLKANDSKLYNELLGDFQFANEDELVLLKSQLTPEDAAGRKLILENSNSIPLRMAALEQMPVSELRSLSLKDRIKYIKEVSLNSANGMEKAMLSVGDAAESSINRLLESTPDHQLEGLLAAIHADGGSLWSSFDLRIHGEEYQEFTRIYTGLMSRAENYSLQKRLDPNAYATEEEHADALGNVMNELVQQEEKAAFMRQKGAAHDDVYVWTDPGMIKQIGGEIPYTIKVKMVERGGQTKVAISQHMGGLQYEAPRYYNPTDLVGIEFQENNSKYGAKKGDVVFMRAAETAKLPWDALTADVWEAVDIIALVLSFVPGLQLVGVGIKALRVAIMVMDILVSVNDLVIGSYREELMQTAEGRSFLAFHKVMSAVMITTSGVQILSSPAVMRKARQLVDALPSKYSELKNLVNKSIGQSAEAELDAIIGGIRKAEDIDVARQQLKALRYSDEVIETALKAARRRLNGLDEGAEAITATRTAVKPRGAGDTIQTGKNAGKFHNFVTEVDGTEYLRTADAYMRRTANGSWERISEVAYKEATMAFKRQNGVSVFEKLANRAEKAKTNLGANVVRRQADLQKAREALRKAIDKNELDLMPESAMAGGMDVSGIGITRSGELIVESRLFAHNMLDPDFARLLDDFNAAGRKLYGKTKKTEEIMSALAKYAYTATGLGLVKTAEGFVTLVEGTLKSLAKVVDKAELRRIYETIGQKEWKFANGDIPTAEQMDEIIDYFRHNDVEESFEDVFGYYEQGRRYDWVANKFIIKKSGGGQVPHFVKQIMLSQKIAPDLIDKGVHFNIGKIELKVVPDHKNGVTFKPVHPSMAAKYNKLYSSAINDAHKALKYLEFRNWLIKHAEKGLQMSSQVGDAKYLEFKFLIKALKEM